MSSIGLDVLNLSFILILNEEISIEIIWDIISINCAYVVECGVIIPLAYVPLNL